jgi:hypothetical protein
MGDQSLRAQLQAGPLPRLERSHAGAEFEGPGSLGLSQPGLILAPVGQASQVT